MAYLFNQDDFNEFLLSEDTHYRIDFPKNSGHSLIQKAYITEDIMLTKSFTCSIDKFSVKHDYVENNGLFMSFLIDGEMKFESNKQKSIIRKQNKTLFLHNEGFNSISTFKQASHYEGLSMTISQRFLDKYLPNLSLNEAKQLQTNPAIYSLAQELYKSQFNDTLEGLQVQSKALDIIRLELLRFSLPEIKQKIMLTPHDTQALQKAKILLENEYKNPPSIEELSKKIRLNEFKLKNGFKSLFGIAPYTFSLKIRMQKAQELLQTGEYNVSEVAKEVGFPYVQNFTKSFIKEFGLRPKDVLKRSQIYI